LRQLGGESGYGVTFIERYLEPLLYPLGLTTHNRILFGLGVFLFNFAIYAVFWRKRRGWP
jgi:hypothetical protein